MSWSICTKNQHAELLPKHSTTTQRCRHFARIKREIVLSASLLCWVCSTHATTTKTGMQMQKASQQHTKRKTARASFLNIGSQPESDRWAKRGNQTHKSEFVHGATATNCAADNLLWGREGEAAQLREAQPGARGKTLPRK